MNRHPLYEYKAHEFTGDEKRFLAAAGWANIPAGDLIEAAATMEQRRLPEVERITFLTRELLAQGYFAARGRAYAFAQSYVQLAAAGTDFTLIVWDWE